MTKLEEAVVHADALYKCPEGARGKDLDPAERFSPTRRDALYERLERVRDLTEVTALSNRDTEFQAFFDAELSRASNAISARRKSHLDRASSLLAMIDSSPVDNSDKERLSSTVTGNLRIRAAKLAEDSTELANFVAQVAAKLREVAQDADARLGTCCLPAFERTTRSYPWKQGCASSMIILLSDVYESIRAAEASERSPFGEDAWVAPTTFERSTTKFWVDEGKLDDLLVAAVSEAPLLVYGRKGRLSNQQDLWKNSQGDIVWDSVAKSISSVYFDSSDMSMYRDRIARHEGAQLLRARWYGKKPVAREPIFLELKTHHEKWINSKSVKERVTILVSDMEAFLTHKKWDLADAEDIVNRANPLLESLDLQKGAELLLNMHDLVVMLRLRPTVRSTYIRAAFQSPSSNALRLTIDRHICLIDETRGVLVPR
jgi:SPX domain protein involved in polyphosphate accumulation